MHELNELEMPTELELLAYLGSTPRVIASNYLDDERGTPGTPGYYEGHWAAVDSNNLIWARGGKEQMKVVAWALTHLGRFHDENKQLREEVRRLRVAMTSGGE